MQKYKLKQKHLINGYKFESCFSDPVANVLHVYCEFGEAEGYEILIDTYDDPFKVYYSNKIPDDREEFEDVLFEYLKNTHPIYFT